MSESNKTYVTHTCNNCEIAFNDIDSIDSYNEPPSWRVCPNCKKLGFKDDKIKKLEEKNIANFDRNLDIYFKKSGKESLSERQMKLLLEIIQKRKEFGKVLHISSCIREALEIDSYYDEG